MQNRYTPRYKPVKILLAMLLVGLVFFTPVVNKTDETPSKLQSVFPELKPFASSADACPWACIECTSWDDSAWPRGCATYECNAACEGEPGSGGGGPVYQPPTISHVLTCSNPGNNGWCIGSLSLDLNASDPQGQSVIISGDVNGTPFTCPNGNTTCSIPLSEGTGTLNYKVDAATGLSASGSANYQVDVTTPQISGSLAGTAGQNGWYVSPTLVTASPSDTLSGIASFEVNVDNAGYTTYADTTFTDGVHTIQYRAYDNAGNYTEVSQTVMVDTIAPSLSAPGGLHLSEVMNYRLDDATSGLAQFSAFIADKDQLQGDAGGAWAVSGNSYSGTFFWDGTFANDGARVGNYLYTLTVTDLAGNQASMMGAYEVQYRNLVYLGLVPNKNNKPDTPPLQVSNPSGAALYQPAPTEAPTEVPSEAIQIPTEEPAPAEPAPILEVRSNVFEGTSAKSAFTAGNQTTTTTPISNANILWGGAATALLGATLAEWQRKRAEEEAARLAALRNSGGGDEGGDGGGRTNAGRKAYQAMMQEKRIVGALQAEQNAKTAQTRAASQRAKDDYRAGEKAYDIAQASTQNTGSGKPLAMPVPVENRVTDKEREEAMTAYREGERNAVSIAEEYKSQVREEAKVINIAGEENRQIESNNLIVAPNSIQDVQSLYFRRDPLWQSNLQSDSNIEAADAITNIAGPSAPTTRLDYFLAAANVNLYLETNTTWWRQFTRWGSGYGPDAKSIVNYYPAATGISLNDSQGIVLSDIQVYAYTYVDKLIITTRVFDKYGDVVYSQADLLPEVKVCNKFHSSHSYEYPKNFFVPTTSNNSLVKIEIYYSAGAFKGESIHEIYQK